jgi:hypothetical protein
MLTPSSLRQLPRRWFAAAAPSPEGVTPTVKDFEGRTTTGTPQAGGGIDTVLAWTRCWY